MQETKKILNLPSLKISAQAVRVPVINAHAESVWVDFKEKRSLRDILKGLNDQVGLIHIDKGYHTPIDASGRDEVFVSRVRQDQDFTNRWIFWVVADNLRKGAATNAIQIAEKLLNKQNFIS